MSSGQLSGVLGYGLGCSAATARHTGGPRRSVLATHAVAPVGRRNEGREAGGLPAPALRPMRRRTPQGPIAGGPYSVGSARQDAQPMVSVSRVRGSSVTTDDNLGSGCVKRVGAGWRRSRPSFKPKPWDVDGVSRVSWSTSAASLLRVASSSDPGRHGCGAVGGVGVGRAVGRRSAGGGDRHRAAVDRRDHLRPAGPVVVSRRGACCGGVGLRRRTWTGARRPARVGVGWDVPLAQLSEDQASLLVVVEVIDRPGHGPKRPTALACGTTTPPRSRRHRGKACPARAIIPFAHNPLHEGLKRL
jgi:hypothetical protein